MTAIQTIYLIGSPPALFMPFYYHFTNKWWTSKEGRLFMVMILLPFGLYLSTALFLLVEQSVVRDTVRTIMVCLASTGTWMTLIVYRMIRHEAIEMRGGNHDRTK